MKKIKLSERIAWTYFFVFFILMLFSSFSIIYFFRKQNDLTIIRVFNEKYNEVNQFLDKIDSFSTKYNSLTLEFNKKLEKQKLVYTKPFNPGENEFIYIVKLTTQDKNTQVVIDTLTPELKNSKKEDNIKKLDENLKNKNINENNPALVEFENPENTYKVIKIVQNIRGNLFEIYIIKDVTDIYNIFGTLFLLVILFTLIGLLATLVLSSKITKKILKPINNIIQTTNSISTDDLTKRIERTNTKDELDELVIIINKMLDRLNISFDNQSKFISDASHELRTPLSIIKGYAEIIKRHGNNDKDLFEESINSIINESNNMKNLVDRLLFLARTEANKVNIQFKKVNSEEFMNKILLDATFMSKNHNFILLDIDNIEFNCDTTLIQQAIRALIENSIKYSKINSNIYFSLKSININNDKKISIKIKDEGIGIATEDLNKIFERFYRVDESRTKETGGNGLGLSIVKKIIDIHNGKILVNSEINKGTEFELII